MAIANIIFSSMTKIIKVRNILLVSKTGSNMTKLMRVSKFTKIQRGTTSYCFSSMRNPIKVRIQRAYSILNLAGVNQSKTTMKSSSKHDQANEAS